MRRSGATVGEGEQTTTSARVRCPARPIYRSVRIEHVKPRWPTRPQARRARQAAPGMTFSEIGGQLSSASRYASNVCQAPPYRGMAFPFAHRDGHVVARAAPVASAARPKSLGACSVARGCASAPPRQACPAGDARRTHTRAGSADRLS